MTKLAIGRASSTLFLGLFLVILLFPTFANGSPSEEMTLYSVADSYVDSWDVDSNFGGIVALTVEHYELGYGSDHVCNAYLRFDLSELPAEASIESSFLTVYADPASTTKCYAHYCSDTSWGELSITWNNAPTFEGSPLSVVVVATTGDSPPFDVTSAIKKAWTSTKALTLVITAEEREGSSLVILGAREQPGERFRPRLKVEYTLASAAQGQSSAVITGGSVVMAVIVLALIGISIYVVSKRSRKREQLAPSSPYAPIKYCMYCGALLPTHAGYCRQCGRKQVEG